MIKYFIYKITNQINGKVYVGQHVTTNKEDLYFGSGFLLKIAIKKHGRENFSKTYLEECFSYEELNEKEIFWIKKLNTITPNGYNIRIGGNNAPMSDLSKQKLSLSQKERLKDKTKNPNLGGKITRKPEIRKKLSDATKARFVNDPNLKNKISRKGKHITPEQSRKQSERLKGKNNPRYIEINENIIEKIIYLYTIEKYGLVEIGNMFNLPYYKIRGILIENNIPIIKNQFKNRHYI